MNHTESSHSFQSNWSQVGPTSLSCRNPWKLLKGGVVVIQLLRHVWLFMTPWTAAHQASMPFTICQSLLEVISIESSVIHFSSYPASAGSFPMSWLFASGGQSIRASASVLPMNIQGWFPLGLTGLISLQPEGLSRVFSSTTVWKHQVLGVRPSLWSNSHICTWLLEKL